MPSTYATSASSRGAPGAARAHTATTSNCSWCSSGSACSVTSPDDHLGERLQDGALVGAERARHLGVHAQHEALVAHVGGERAHLLVDLGAHRGDALHLPAARAVRARLHQHPLERLLHPLAGEDHEAELVHREHLRRRAVAAQLLLERAHHVAPALALLHVDEVDDDDPAEVAQADLPHDLAHGVEVRLEERLLEVVLPDEAAGVDVDRDEGLGLVDDDVAAGRQPHLRPQRPLELGGDAGLLHDPGRALVEPDAAGEHRLERPHELERLVVLALVVEADRGHVVGEQVAQQPLEERRLAVEEHRRAVALGEGPDLVPRAGEEPPVAQERLGLAALAGGARDEPAPAPLLPELLQDRLEPPPLLVVGDLARDADVLDRRHEDEVAAGERHVRRDARALRPQRLLEDLDDDLLALVQPLLDRGLPRGLLLLGGEEVLRQLLEDVGGVEERVALEAEVHERGLHAGQHPRDPSLVDAAHDPAVGLALDEELRDDALLQEGDAGLAGGGADDELSGHSEPGGPQAARAPGVAAVNSRTAASGR